MDWLAETAPAPAAAPQPAAKVDWLYETAPTPMARAEQKAKVAPPGMMESLKTAVTGEGQYEFDLPEIPFVGQLLSSLARDDAGKIDILSKHYPDMKFGQDSHGNTVVVHEGKSYYLNRPGLTGSDVTEAAVDAPFEIAGGVLGGGVGRAIVGGGAKRGVLSAIGRLAGTGTGTAGGAVARDVAAQAAGSEQGIDPNAAATAGIFGLTGELAAPLVNYVFRRTVSRGIPVMENGAPTPQARKAAAEALNVDPAQLTPDFWAEFAKYAKDAADPKAAARAAEASSLPVQIPLSRGDVSGLASDQMTESLMKKGAFGRQAELTMRGFRDEQQAAIRGNIPAIQKRLSGDTAQPISPGEGVAAAQDQLVRQREAARSRANTLFDKAREKRAAIPKDEARETGLLIRQRVAEDHSLEGLPRTTQLLDQLNEITSTGPNADIRTLFEWRKRATNAARGNPGSEEGVALRKAIGEFDRWIDSAVERDMLAGDAQAVKAWQAALSNYKDFASAFKGKDAVQALTERTERGGRLELKVAPEDAANWLLTAGNTGFVAKPNLTRDMQKLKSMLPKEEWNAVREEVFLRFVQAGEGAMEANTRQFSGTKFLKAWRDAQRKNPALLNTLFTKPEQNLISQFADVSAKATGRVAGGDNYSNTIPAAANVMQMIISRLPFSKETAARALFGANVLNVGDFAGAIATRGATQGKPVPRMLPPGFSGGAAAAIAPED